MRCSKWAVAAILMALAVAAWPIDAEAAGDRGEPVRDGFVFGFSAGFGSSFPCDECPSFAGDFHVGAMATPRLAVIADFSAVGGDDDRWPVEGGGVAVGAIAAKFWPADRFWLKVGVGVASTFRVDVSDDDDWRDHDSEKSWAGVAGAGFEIARKRSFVMDVQARGVVLNERQSVAIGIGFAWY